MSKSNKIILAILAIAILVMGIVIVATSGEDEQTATTPNDNTTEQQPQQPNDSENEDEAQIEATITYTNNGFEPGHVTVPAGSTIAVVNQSNSDLEFASDPHPTHTDNFELNVGLIEPGGRITFIAEQTGTWGYHNHLNPSRTGQITVE